MRSCNQRQGHGSRQPTQVESHWIDCPMPKLPSADDQIDLMKKDRSSQHSFLLTSEGYPPNIFPRFPDLCSVKETENIAETSFLVFPSCRILKSTMKWTDYLLTLLKQTIITLHTQTIVTLLTQTIVSLLK